MKKFIAFMLCALMFTSCATVFSGFKRADSCQACRPANEKRKMQSGYLIADMVACAFGMPVPLLIDFATGHIYRPCDKTKPTTGK